MPTSDRDQARAGHRAINRLVSVGMFDAYLGALLELLIQSGVPLLIVSPDPAVGRRLSQSLAGHFEAAASLEEVVARHPGDRARSLGLVLIADAASGQERVASAYYMRPIERDAAGHLQRRPPALLAAWDAQGARYDLFDWAVTDELAARAGMARADFEREVRRREAEFPGADRADSTVFRT